MFTFRIVNPAIEFSWVYHKTSQQRHSLAIRGNFSKRPQGLKGSSRHWEAHFKRTKQHPEYMSRSLRKIEKTPDIFTVRLDRFLLVSADGHRQLCSICTSN